MSAHVKGDNSCLKSFTYSNTFPSTGRTLSGQFDFRKGFGTITGRNESGKSFVFEMVRYCLFGSAALRGKAEDYKKLVASLTFAVKGNTYTVNRKSTGATFFRDAEQIATGTRPVNEKINDILGFGLEVFDLACVANQGELERLGTMKPAERKKMVDSTIGMGVIEELARWAIDQAQEKTREVETIERICIKPVGPVAPANNRPSAEIQTEIAELTALKSEYDRLQGFLKVERPVPQRPKENIQLPAESLRALGEEQDASRARLSALNAQLRSTPHAPPCTAKRLQTMLDQHEAHDRWQERLRFEKSHPLPAFTAEQLDEMQEAWNRIEAYKYTDDLKKRLDKALAQGHHECPKCAHRWPIAGTEVTKLEELIRVEGIHDRPIDPKLARVQINREREIIADVLSTAEERDRLTVFTEVTAPKLSRDQIARAQLALAKADERAMLATEAAQIEQLIKTQPDYRAMYEARVAYEAALKQYLLDSAEYQKWLGQRSEAQARAAAIQPRLGCLSTLQDELLAAVTYEQAISLHEKAVVDYTSRMAEVDQLKTEADGWKRAKSALSTLRTLVKQHLVPSLNRVASSLIRSMTGGQRHSIVVDEEFDVMIDGQPLNTLSGSLRHQRAGAGKNQSGPTPGRSAFQLEVVIRTGAFVRDKQDLRDPTLQGLQSARSILCPVLVERCIDLIAHEQ